jgi:hypothetical protein
MAGAAPCPPIPGGEPMKYDSVDRMLVGLWEASERIGHHTAWNEFCVAVDGEPGTGFAFFTLDAVKARQAIALLGAAGLLCETPTGPENPDEYLPYLEHLTTYPPMAVCDGLRALAGTWVAP